ncbi:MAG TPA: lysylphosphatidylglycerol synthase transmembrane domain-containing protein [Ktedonosporobacter sp.]|nr:lysylphosphatidylglycerol synthase transmembrane domain-containing protein [Ktedonosporobacter sp.]
MTTSLPDPTIEARQPFSINPYVTRPIPTDPFATRPMRSAAPALAPVRKQDQRKWLKLALRTGMTLLLLFFLVRSLSWPTLLTTLMHVNQMALIMGLSIGMLCIIFSAYTWRSLVLGEGIATDLSKLINLYFVGLAFSHFLPTSVGGDAIKAFYVGRDSGNIAGAASSVMMSRIAGFLGMLLIALPTLLIWHMQFTSSLIVGFLLLSLLVVAMIGGAIFFSAHLSTLSTRFLKASWVRHRIFATVLKVGDALSAAFRRPQALGAAILFAMLFWVASFLNYYGYAEALGLHLPLYFYVVAVSFTSIVAFLPISINGYGVRESAMVYVFSTIHIAPGTSLLLALLMDAQVLLFGIVGGFIYFAMSNRTRT